MCLVEAIKQICSKRPNDKILVSASSNTAADLLCERLSTGDGRLLSSQMFRLMAERRKVSDLSPMCHDYASIDVETHSFQTPTTDVIEDYQVVVSTMSTASKLFNLNVRPGHFNVFVFDESGYTNEPELISTFASLLHPDVEPQLILAGDHHQLSPRSRSTVANGYGFSQSILERFITSIDCYKRDSILYPQSFGYNTKYITKLVRCYRCHDDILKLPNQFFYDNDLIASGNRAILDNFLNVNSDDILPNKNFPLVFHSSAGENVREQSSPSWFNITECEIVLDYVMKLQENLDKYNITLKDIGIISPYARQVQKIKKLLVSKGCDDIDVGTCELYQGKEKKVRYHNNNTNTTNNTNTNTT